MTATMPTTRFVVEVWVAPVGEYDEAAYTLTCDCPGVFLCREGDEIRLSDGHATEVYSIVVSPGRDPAVLVVGQNLVFYDRLHAKAMVADICNDSRWVPS